MNDKQFMHAMDMWLERRQPPATNHEEKTMPHPEVDSELLVLAASLSDSDHQELCDRLCDMPPAELKLLRQALSRIDGALDALALDRHLRRDE